MTSDDLIAQARAKIMWGESKNAVREFLTLNGLSEIEADRKLAEFCSERNVVIRKAGLKKVLIGGSLTGISCVLLLFTSQTACLVASYHSAGGRGIIVFAGLYGLWKLIDGILGLVRPQSETKPVTELPG